MGTKTIYFNGDKVEIDYNETFFEIISNNPEDEKNYKIDLYDNDSQPKLIVNIEGKKIITRAKKGDTYKSVFERMKINFKNFFFLKQGSALQSEDLERRLSIKGEKEVNLLGYKAGDINDENEGEIKPNENGENKETVLNMNENKKQIPNDKNDLNNEKIYKPNENDIEEDKVKTNIDENNDKDGSMGSNGSLSERDKRNFIIKAILILIVELCTIMLFLWIGFICDINKSFIKSLGSMLSTFIPIVLILSLLFYIFWKL